MTKWQYWSPFFIGAVIGGVSGLQAFKDASGNPLLWMAVLPIVVALIAGAQFQLLMFAAQAFSASVLPVPFGKSLRGARCRVIGALLFLGPLIGLVLRMSESYAFVHNERHALTTFWQIWFIGWIAIGGLCYVAALLIYLYSVPMAKTDFQG